MNKPPDKAQLRAELEQATRRFLREGGQVQHIAKGISGREDNSRPAYLDQQLFAKPRESRTPVPEVIAAIEERRQARSNAKPKKTAQRRARRKTVYDDFGEPLRRVWVDD